MTNKRKWFIIKPSNEREVNKIFEVWNDEKWVDGNDVYTFGTLVEAIEFAKHMANCGDETEEIVAFWMTSSSDAISLGEWAIQEV